MNITELIERLALIQEKLGYPNTEIVKIEYKEGDDYLIIENEDDRAIHLPVSSFAKTRFQRQIWL